MKKLILLILLALILTAFLGTLLTGTSPVRLYGTVDPLRLVILLSACLAFSSFLFGAVTGDYSWVDRLWSIAPVSFAWIYAIRSGMDPLLLVSALLISLWGSRLTYNFARKGGYSGTEDYRWPILRKKIGNPILWQLFNLLFICGFQIGLMVGFTAPLYLIYQNPGYGLHSGVFTYGLLFLVFLAFETIADNQQWRYHLVKIGSTVHGVPSAYRFTRDIHQGFLSSELFRYARHPNYFGELALWWCIYLIGALPLEHIINISIVGPLLLTLLFIGSTKFTESITSSKYPDYAEYRKKTSPIIPWFPKNERLSAVES